MTMRIRLLCVCAALLACLSPCLGGGAPAKQPAPPVTTLRHGDYVISGPYTHENLAVFLIHGKDRLKAMQFLTLAEAIRQKAVVVHETDDVNSLTIENKGTIAIYVQGGQIVKGGKQDRVLQYDLLLSPRSGKVAIGAFCVESGRWQRRGGESAAQFEQSSEMLVSKDQKLAAKREKSQQKVWQEVAQAQQSIAGRVGESVQSGASPSSLQLTLENKKLNAAVAAYTRGLEGILADRDDAIGYAFAINGKINSADIYGAAALFRKLWPLLLKASAVEAFAEREQARQAAPPGPEAVKALIEAAAEGKESRKNLSPRTALIERQGKAASGYITTDKDSAGAVVHENLLAH